MAAVSGPNPRPERPANTQGNAGFQCPPTDRSETMIVIADTSTARTGHPTPGGHPWHRLRLDRAGGRSQSGTCLARRRPSSGRRP